MAELIRVDVRRCVIDALSRVQELGGHEKTEISEDTTPIGGLAGFDSLTGVEVTMMICDRLGIEVGADVNLFVVEDGRRAATVDEIVDRIIAAAKEKR